MTTFFLPLGIGSEWDNNETRYLLRSFEQNFKGDYNVITYCQDKPDWLDIEHKIVDRFYPDGLEEIYGCKKYENYFDVLNKVYLFVNSDECPEEFVYIYDDILLLQPIIKSDIINTPQFRITHKSYVHNAKTRWGETINQTYKMLGMQGFNFEHHIPMVYKRDKLKQLFKLFPIDKTNIPYSLGTAYFNTFSEEMVLGKLEGYRICFEGFYHMAGTAKQDSIKDIENATKDITWVNYNDTGLSWLPKKGYPLKEWIENKFPNKSRFE